MADDFKILFNLTCCDIESSAVVCLVIVLVVWPFMVVAVTVNLV